MSQDTYKQRVTLVACAEKSAKLTPLARTDGPRGKACPGETVNGQLFESKL